MLHTPWQMLSQAERAQFWATLALKHTQGIGPRTIVRLLRFFGSAYAALENKNFWHEAGVSREKARLLGAGSWRKTALQEWHDAQRTSAHLILWHHKNYPSSLRSLVDAPSILYYSGDISLLSLPCFAIVGSRKCSAEGVQVAGNIARDLSRAGICIVSGAAQGIDRVAHVAALAHVGKSIGILGTGIDIAYPKSNEDLFKHLHHEGLLISEFAPQTQPLASNFPIRNRIVSGLSLGVLVVEGLPSSGSLITARLALEQNREVYAIPGAATAALSRGCQELIRQGAKPVFNAEDILQDLALRLQEFVCLQSVQGHIERKEQEHKATEPDIALIQNMDSIREEKLKVKDEGAHIPCEKNILREEEADAPSSEEQEERNRILNYLHAHGAVHIDILCTALERDISQLQMLLVEMELATEIKKLPGARYSAQKA